MEIRTEHYMIGVLLALIACLALLLVGVVYFFAPIEAKAITTTTLKTTTKATTTIVKSTTTSSTTSRITTTTSYTTTTAATTTTTTTMLKVDVQIPLGNIYKNDNVKVKVVSEEGPTPEATVTLDDSLKYTTDSFGEVTLIGMQPGSHTLNAVKEGYETAYANFEVNIHSYAFSTEVTKQKTPEERERLISEGKTVLIFYDLPNCVNCMAMKPWVADIVSSNRECISYELLNIYNDGPREELKEMLIDQSTVSTPVIVIQGEGNRYISTGFRTKSGIEEELAEVAEGRCELK